MTVSNFRSSFDIRDIGIRVSESFYINQFRVRFDGILQFFIVVGIDKSRFYTITAQRVLEKIVRTAIYCFGCNNMVSCICNICYGISYSSCAGSNSKSAYSAFKSRNATFQNPLRGIGKTTVYIACIAQSETICCVLGVMKHIRSGLINRYCAGICGRICLFLSDMKLQCFEV